MAVRTGKSASWCETTPRRFFSRSAMSSILFALGLEPEQPNRCEEEWGEPASQGFEPGSGVIGSPECLGYWGDRYLWHPNTLRGDGAVPGRTGAAPVHGERGAGGRPRRRDRGGRRGPVSPDQPRPAARSRRWPRRPAPRGAPPAATGLTGAAGGTTSAAASAARAVDASRRWR